MQSSINCSTDLNVNTIEWLDSNGEVLASGNESPLTLNLTVTSDLHNTEYTCRINSSIGTQEQSITLTVLQKALLAPAVGGGVSIVIILVLLVIVILLVGVAVWR